MVETVGSGENAEAWEASLLSPYPVLLFLWAEEPPGPKYLLTFLKYDWRFYSLKGVSPCKYRDGDL